MGYCRVVDGDRLSVEMERSASYVSEVSQLKEQVTSRDRAVIDINNELESLRREFTRLNDVYQQQTQIAQHATYDLLTYLLNGRVAYCLNLRWDGIVLPAALTSCSVCSVLTRNEPKTRTHQEMR